MGTPAIFISPEKLLIFPARVSRVFSKADIVMKIPARFIFILKILWETTSSPFNFIVQWACPTFEPLRKTSYQRSNSLNELGSFASLPKSENPSVWRMTITIKDTNRTEEYWPSTKLLGFKVGRFLILDRQFVSVFANSRDYNS